MENISSNPAFNPATLYRKNTPQPNRQPHEAVAPQSPATVAASNDPSDVFGDDQLLRLQGNLEAISKMAEEALKRFES